MSSCDARPVKFTVTKITIPENMTEFYIKFMTNMQFCKCGTEFDTWMTGGRDNEIMG